MDAADLIPKRWYWIRRTDGSLAPYVFYQVRQDYRGKTVAEFFVGSYIQTFGLNQIVAEAKMAEFCQPDR